MVYMYSKNVLRYPVHIGRNCASIYLSCSGGGLHLRRGRDLTRATVSYSDFQGTAPP